MPFDPDYAGELVTIHVDNVVDDDGLELDDTSATAQLVEIAAYDGTVVHGPHPIPWEPDAAPPGWVYVWDTVGVPAGEYRGQVAVTPHGSLPSWRFVDLVLAPPPSRPIIPYGATVADVKALLPHRRWTAGTKPDVADVERFIVSAASVIDLRIDDLPDILPPAVAGRLVALARRAVALGAAAQTEAAGGPERARPNDASSYAQWLQERYAEAVERVETYAAGLAGGETPGTGSLDEPEPAWFFPEPVGWAARGI